MTTLIAILAVGAGSLAFRLLPLLAASRARHTARLDRALDAGAAAAIAALLVSDVRDVPTADRHSSRKCGWTTGNWSSRSTSPLPSSLHVNCCRG